MKKSIASFRKRTNTACGGRASVPAAFVAQTARTGPRPPLLVILAMALIAYAPIWARDVPTSQPYTECSPAADGIGKVYMGREIAQVMGHTGADWLERPEREAEEQPSILLKNMD